MSQAFEPLPGHGFNRVPKISGSMAVLVLFSTGCSSRSIPRDIFYGSANGSSLEDCLGFDWDGVRWDLCRAMVFYIEKVVALSRVRYPLQRVCSCSRCWSLRDCSESGEVRFDCIDGLDIIVFCFMETWFLGWWLILWLRGIGWNISL